MPVIELSKGTTHYELAGPEDGPLVVLLHGGSIPLWTWDCQVPALLQAGFRVLRYDMYGKGKSACPAVAYDRDLFQAQLLELLSALEISTPFNLVGFSFGGATAVTFATRFPERVSNLALIAPVLCFEQDNTLVRMARLPLLGRLYLRYVVMNKSLERASRLWASVDNPRRYEQLFLEQISRPEFAQAILSFLRTNALGDYADTYRRLGATGRSLLLVWGSSDDVIPAAHVKLIRQYLPGADYHELPGMDHGLVYEAAAQINELLLGFLQPGRPS